MTSSAPEALAVDSDPAPIAPASPDLHESKSAHSAAHSIEANRLSVDHDEDEEYIEIPTSATASVSSSLYEHVEENGRTYHKYKEGKYVLPNDELEQNRLDLQHHLCKIALHDRLHLAPLKEEALKVVLDFGTGTGIWAIEFAERYPKAQVIGSDLSPIQPEFVPPNLSFEVDDAEDEWIYPHPFSYIHGRFMVLAMSNPLAIFQKAFEALSPGGWLEMQEQSAPLRSIDGSIEGTSMLKCSNMIVQACLKRGVDLTAPVRYKAMMEEVGFVDVKEVVIEWPIGTWAKSKYHKRIGAWYHHDLSMGMEGVTMGLFTRILGMSKEEVLEIVEDVKKDMNNKKIHGYQAFYVVYGRKPK